MPDEEDEGPTTINFATYYVIGTARLGLTTEEVGHMTIRRFNKLYEAYKRLFDTELTLTLAGMTYAEADAKADSDEEWI